ncbi:MAG TPA: TonB-dependent receptor, partial [Petrimonas sp.]|nr:TonB-dependent receptor [Petrimonas sp.]
STELIHHLGGQYTRSMDHLLFMPAELTAGAEYLNNTLTDVSGYRTHDVDQKAHTASGFLQNEWKDGRWSILLGGRLDKHSLVKSAIFSPRANIR